MVGEAAAAVPPRRAAHRAAGAAAPVGSRRPVGGKVKAFCSECGSSLCGGDWPEGEEISVRLGSLDDDPEIRPQYHTFVGARAPWDELPEDGLPRYEGGP